MAGTGKRAVTFQARGGKTRANTARKVVFTSVPTKALTHRKVAASKQGLTLDARFTIATQLRQQASSRQSQGRDALLAKKRGLAVPAAARPPQQQSGAVQSGGSGTEGKGKRRGKAKGGALQGSVRVRPTAPARVVLKSKGKKKGRGGKGRGSAGGGGSAE